MTQQFGRRTPASSGKGGPPPPGARIPGAFPAISVDDELEAWKRGRKQHAAPHRYIFAASMLAGVAVSFLLPDTPGLIVRVLLFIFGLGALTIGRRSWARREIR